MRNREDRRITSTMARQGRGVVVAAAMALVTVSSMGGFALGRVPGTDDRRIGGQRPRPTGVPQWSGAGKAC